MLFRSDVNNHPVFYYFDTAVFVVAGKRTGMTKARTGHLSILGTALSRRNNSTRGLRVTSSRFDSIAHLLLPHKIIPAKLTAASQTKTVSRRTNNALLCPCSRFDSIRSPPAPSQNHSSKAHRCFANQNSLTTNKQCASLSLLSS
jgi:hypothetical protein